MDGVWAVASQVDARNLLNNLSFAFLTSYTDVNEEVLLTGQDQTTKQARSKGRSSPRGDSRSRNDNGGGGGYVHRH